MTDLSWSYNSDSVEIEMSVHNSGRKYMFLPVIICVSFLLPLVILFLIFIQVESVKLGFVITLLIFWGTAWYFLKLYLWNRFGKEKIKLTNRSVYITYDYKLYKITREFAFIPSTNNMGIINQNKQQIPLSDLNNSNGNQAEKFWFQTDEELLKTTIDFSSSIKDLNLVEFKNRVDLLTEKR